MEDLIEKIKTCLANSFAFTLKTQSYHWNVIGSDFPQLHDLFGRIYEEVDGAVDALAEHIRQLDAFAPGTLTRMLEIATIEEDDRIPVASKMVTNLIDANDVMIACLEEAYTMAEEQKKFGLSNYLQDRLTAHSKHRWMLKATAGQKE
jgi:starvation-inducible DNA-binding protein